MHCPLCLTRDPAPFATETFGDRYLHCAACDYRFQHPRFRLSPAEEAAHYATHRNALDDPGYRAFLQPLADAVGARLASGARGLDFGAGPGPLLARMLAEAGRPTAIYDPLYHPDASALDARYDFVTVSEVVEHFHDPRGELARLATLLRPGGWLGVMTLLYHDAVDFRNWHYRREKTHVGFFSRATFAWIAAWAGFAAPEFVGNRVILLRRRS